MAAVQWGCGVELLPSVQVRNTYSVLYFLNNSSIPGQPLFLSLQGVAYTTNNSNILVTRIETTNYTSLTCHTDSPTCCRGMDNPDGNIGFGEWLFPNGMEIARNRVTSSGFYWVRNLKAVRLYRQGDIQTPLGTYCCRIPDSGGVLRTVCANLTSEFTVTIIK